MHPFFTLRDQLPTLHFDPSVDKDITDGPLLAEYINFYKLPVTKNICSVYRIGTFNSDPYRIVAQYWLPTTHCKGTVLFLHGYYDHVGLFSDLINFLLTEGFAVIAYDQAGHGLSSGEPASIKDFSEYVDIFQTCVQKTSALPEPHFFVGQSTGCAVFLHNHLIEKYSSNFQQVVLLAPLIRPAHWNTGVWLYRLLAPFTKQIFRRISQNSHNQQFVDFVHHQDPLQSQFLKTDWVGAMKHWLDLFPSLAGSSLALYVIQGESDETVDWKYNTDILQKKFPVANIYTIPRARHHLANEAPEFQQQVFSQLKRFLLASS